MTAAAAPPVRRSPVVRDHERLAALMQVEAGWQLPVSYGDDDAERAAVRDRVGLADITARGKVDVRGDVDAAFSAAGDEVVARIASTWGMAFTPPGGEEILLPKLEAAVGPRAMVTDATHLFAGFALSGPFLADVIARTSGWDPAGLPAAAATGAPIADVRAVMVRRDLEVPVLEVYAATELARYVWETLHGVVTSLGGRAVGWRTLREGGWS